MRNQKELLTKTAGLARLGRAYADGIQCGAIDGDDFGIALSDMTIKGCKSRSGEMEVYIDTKSEQIVVRGCDVRGLFAVLHGIVSAEYDEAVDDGTTPPPPPTPDFLATLDLLRTAQGMMGEPSEIEGSQEWFDATDKLLGKYPQAAT